MRGDNRPKEGSLPARQDLGVKAEKLKKRFSSSDL